MHLLRGPLQASSISILTLALFCVQASAQITTALSVIQPDTSAKIYRGAIGTNHIEMRLKTEGNSVSGTYAYDRIGQEITINGRYNSAGTLEIAEFDTRGKQTGKFTCKSEPEALDADLDCDWSRPGYPGKTYALLSRQHIAFANGLRVVPKVITAKKTGVAVSYPQITGGTGALAAAAQNFNLRMSYLVNKAIREFEPGRIPGRVSFDTNYNVLFGASGLVSIEMSEYSDAGGAHPNSRFWAVTYDLSANRELKLAELFKPRADYKSAIAKYALADINKRAEQIAREDAQREGRKVEPKPEVLVSIEELSPIASWAMTPKGLMIYFDFPHVIAVFDKTFIPYTALSNDLQLVAPSKRP